MLVSGGVITQEQLGAALAVRQGSSKRLGEVLIETGVLTEEKLIKALERQLGVQSVDLMAYPPAPDAAGYLPQSIARKHQVVPLGINGDTLYLAMVDPLNFLAIEEAKKYSGRKVVPMITSRRKLEQASAKLYGSVGAAQAIQDMRRELNALPAAAAGTALDHNITDDPSAAPTIRLVNSILERAVTERASDIHFEPRENEMVVRLRIDGALHTVFHVPAEAMNAVVSRLKVMGNMDIAERKIPQDGRSVIRIHNKEVDLRISTLPTVYGEKMVIRLLDKSAANLGRQGIGLTGTSLERYEELLRNSSGVILISGPTGSGKSSTMYTMIQDLNTEEVNLVTLEDPVEFNTPGVNQCQVNEKTGMTFAAGLRSIRRQDPDIIVVGEIRDGETASIAMRAAITGHLVLSTIHASKGLEYDRVILIDVVDGVLPNAAEPEAEPAGLEEERRLFYVGVTRAKRQLELLTYEEKFGVPAESGPTFVSQLLGEAPRQEPQAAVPPKGPSTEQVAWWEKDYLPGTEVTHRKFGRGLLQSKVGNIAVISFREAGVKKVDLTACLKKGLIELTH